MPHAESAIPAVPKRLTVGLCAVFLGSLGVHKFLLGRTTAGVITLLVTLLTFVGGAVMALVGVAEGVIYLRKSNADFHNSYVVNKRDWF